MYEQVESSAYSTGKSRKPVKACLACLADLILLALAYWSVALLEERATLGLAPLIKLGCAFGLVWFMTTILTRKCTRIFEVPLRQALAKLVWTALLMTLAISILLVILGLTGFGRTYLFGTMGLYLLMEMAVYAGAYLRLKRLGLIRPRDEVSLQKKGEQLFVLAGLDLALLICAYLGIYALKRETLVPDQDYLILLQFMLAVWLVSSWLTRKFFKPALPNYLNSMEICFKSAFLMAGFMAALVFGLHLLTYSRTQIFGTILVLWALDFLLYGVYFAFRASRTQDRDVESATEVRAMMEQSKYDLPQNCPGQGVVPGTPLRSSLQAGLELIQPWLFDFLDQQLDLEKIYKDRALILSTDEYLSLHTTANVHGLSLLLNLQRVNDQRFLNRYFLEVHRLMKKGAYFVGKVQTYRNVRARFKRKYSRNLAFVLSVLHFGLHRLLPKLPITKQVYFALTKGRNRAISKAEVLGRLSFCGFEIMTAQDFEDYLYFIVRKTKQPSTVTDPSYGPLIALKRTGSKGQPIWVYKFRTMHPYSEFLQDYIYALNQLSPGGKIADDFRVTEYGKIMRKLWLDELPMLYNWLRGDLQLIGVRPLSRHFFSLYPAHVQRLRQETKPGLLPPFYADMPKTLEEICSSEEKYLCSYFQAPFKTQVRYLFLTMYNIVVKGARSG